MKIFDVNPSKIDVNIHPTKSEIKFEDERMVYSILNSIVRKTISTVQLANSLDFGSDINSPTNRVLEAVGTRNNKPMGSYKDSTYTSFKNYDKNYYDQNQLSNFYKEINQLSAQEENIQTEIVTLESKINERTNKDQFVSNNPRILFADKYIFTPIGDEMIIVDLYAARERIVYDRLIKTLESTTNTSQQLLFPEKVFLSSEKIELLRAETKIMRGLGLVFKVTDNKSIVISSLPSSMADLDINIIMEEIILSIKNEDGVFSLTKEANHKLATKISKRIVSIRPKTFREEELEPLLGSLFATSNCKYTSYGRKIIYKMDEEKIKMFFDDMVSSLN